MTFQELQLREELLKALAHQGYSNPTPIQSKAIPHILAGRDMLGIAQTGTGKTAAFALPVIQLMAAAPTSNKKSIRCLVLTPTRELALQVEASFADYGKFTSLRSCVIFGGVGQQPQVEQIRRGVDVLIATPGRLLDLMQQRLLSLDSVRWLVLDEADRMLDMGFIHDVKKVIAAVPRERQTLFFSATMPGEVADLSRNILSNPIRVEVAPPATTAELVSQQVYLVDKANKRHLLQHVLKDSDIGRVLVFTRTKHGADKVARELSKSGITAQAIHGNKSQNQRQAALQGFKTMKIRVLVATDIAARGIDIDQLSHVIQFDLPNVPETYVHRIGRTGRAGSDGTAIAFCDSEERAYLRDIEKLTGQRIPVISEHPWPLGSVAPSSAPQTNTQQRQNARPGRRNNQARPERRNGPPNGQRNHNKPNQDRRNSQPQQSGQLQEKKENRPASRPASNFGKNISRRINRSGGKSGGFLPPSDLSY